MRIKELIEQRRSERDALDREIADLERRVDVGVEILEAMRPSIRFTFDVRFHKGGKRYEYLALRIGYKIYLTGKEGHFGNWAEFINWVEENVAEVVSANALRHGA